MAGTGSACSTAARSKFFGSADFPTCTKPISLAAPSNCSPCRFRAARRYQDRPVYFSDVVVRRDRAHFESFVDLRGASWAYNEPRSHSGFNVVRAYLAESGHLDDFFGAVVESGAHSESLEMVLSGRVDGAAIDSTVLEWLTAQRKISRMKYA